MFVREHSLLAFLVVLVEKSGAYMPGSLSEALSAPLSASVLLLTNQHQTNQRIKPSVWLRASAHKPKTTLNNGYLGSHNDEERSEMRYVV